MITVGDIRKAIEGLPDDGEVLLTEQMGDFVFEDVSVDLVAFAAEGPNLRVKVRINDLEAEDGGQEDDWEDDEPVCMDY